MRLSFPYRTYDEALREIGAAPGSSPEEIRRAYLRLVKTRKPESDPEGFRRLREAFELLRDEPEPSPEIRLDLTRTFPQTLVPEETARLETTEDSDELCSAAEEWLARGRPEPAVETMLRALETAEAQGQTNSPPPLHVIRLLLQLQALEHAAEAARLQERFAQRLRSAGLELDVLDSRTAALWQIAQEISRLPPGFPREVRAAIARAVNDGTLQTALPSLQNVVKEDPDAGWRMASDLKELPALRSLYHGAVLAALPARRGHEPVISQSSKPVIRDAAESRRALVIVLVVAAALGGLYALFAPAPPAIPLSPALENAVQATCRHGAAPTPAEAELCRAARNLAVRLEQRRCSRTASDAMLEAHQKVQAQTSRTAGDSGNKADAAVLDLFFEYSRLCSSP